MTVWRRGSTFAVDNPEVDLSAAFLFGMVPCRNLNKHNDMYEISSISTCQHPTFGAVRVLITSEGRALANVADLSLPLGYCSPADALERLLDGGFCLMATLPGNPAGAFTDRRGAWELFAHSSLNSAESRRMWRWLWREAVPRLLPS